MRARREFALLRRTIDHEIEQVASDPTIIQQRGALGRGAVSRKFFSARLELIQQSDQFAFAT